MDNTKPFFKSLTLWVNFAIGLATLITTNADLIPEQYRAKVLAYVASALAIFNLLNRFKTSTGLVK